MGQKIHPIGFRIGVIRDADSKWYADKQYAQFVLEDYTIRKMIKKRKGWDNASISKIEIERQANQVRVTLHTAKPGIIIGRGGAGVDLLKGDLEKITGKTVHVNVAEIRHLETNAQLVAESIAQQIEKRIGYKRAMRQAVTRAMKLGVRGIRCHVAGRLGGAEMARREQDRQGKIPLAHPACRYRLRIRRSGHDLLHHWGEGLDLQGRYSSGRTPSRRAGGPAPRPGWRR